MAVASNIEPPTDLPTLRKSVGQKRSSLFSSGNADTEETKKYTTEKLQKKSSIADLFEELSRQRKLLKEAAGDDIEDTVASDNLEATQKTLSPSPAQKESEQKFELTKPEPEDLSLPSVDSASAAAEERLTTIDLKAYMKAVAMRESSNNADTVNTHGYLGLYQFGIMALKDAGHVKMDAPNSNKALEDPDNWTSKNGVGSKEDFLANPTAQSLAMEILTSRNLATLRRAGVLTPRSTATEIAGALAPSHLVGASAYAEAILNGEDPEDAFGTKASEYSELGVSSQLGTLESEDNEGTIPQIADTADTSSPPQVPGGEGTVPRSDDWKPNRTHAKLLKSLKAESEKIDTFRANFDDPSLRGDIVSVEKDMEENKASRNSVTNAWLSKFPTKLSNETEEEYENRKADSYADKLHMINDVQTAVIESWGGVLDFTRGNLTEIAEWTQKEYPTLYKNITDRDPEGVGKSGTRLLSAIVYLLDAPLAMLGAPSTALRVASKAIKADMVGRKTARVATLKTAEVKRLADEFATKIANANRTEKNLLIREFEARETARMGEPVILSKADKDGNLELDMEQVSKLGKEIGDRQVQGGYVPDQPGLMQNTIIPKNLDGVVAMYATLKKSGNFDTVFNKDKSVIENLADLVVTNKLSTLQKDELIQTAIDFNVDVNDVILIGIGSGSEAGKLLQKFSEIKRAGFGDNQKGITENKLLDEPIRGTEWKDFIRRFESLRRGMVVSMVKTASRNFISGLERTPFEIVANYLQTIMWTFENKGALRGIASTVSPTNMLMSMRPLVRMFDDPVESKNFVRLILDNPTYRTQWMQVTEAIGEIRRYQGAGATKHIPWGSTGAPKKVVDNMLSEAEAIVDVLNGPNRMQEQIVRQGFILAEMERLVKLEWEVDLIPRLQEGKLGQLINNSPSLRPEGARPWSDIVADSVRKGMDVTYAGRPDWKTAGQVVDILTRSVVGTVAVNMFPRFVVNGMETVFQFTAGSLVPIVKISNRALAHNRKGPIIELTSRDREYVSRNIVGLGALYGTVQYFDSDDAPDDYRKIGMGDNEADTTPFFPTRQLFYIANAYRHWRDGTLKEWFGSSIKEIEETFLGSSARHMQGQATFPLFTLIGEITESIKNEEAITGEQAASMIGRAASNYFSTWWVQPNQLAEFQRAVGRRGNVRVNRAEDLKLTEGGIKAEVARRLPINKPDDDNIQSLEMRTGESLDDMSEIDKTINDPELLKEIKKGNVVVSPWYGASKYINQSLSAILGITSSPSTKRKNKDGTYLEPVAEFFTRYNYEEYETGSKLYNAPLAKFRQNLLLAQHYPSYIEGLKEVEYRLNYAWDNNGTVKTATGKPMVLTESVKKKYEITPYRGLGISVVTSSGKDKFMHDQMIPYINDVIKNARKNFSKENVGEWYRGVSKEQTTLGEYVDVHMKYRKIPSASRTSAQSAYVAAYDAYPDLTDADVLATLIEFAEGQKTLRPKK
tara:strand:- start:51 stop:4472 length:4422 start_codon:yes stop_codon:yes gene_type:complete